MRQLQSNNARLGIGDFTARHLSGTTPALRTAPESDFKGIRVPDAAFHYSNIGFNLLGTLIEDVSGKDFGDFLEEAVMASLGLQRASLNWSPALTKQVPVRQGLQTRRIITLIYPACASGKFLADIDDLSPIPLHAITKVRMKNTRTEPTGGS